MDRNWDVPVSSARSWFRKQCYRSTKDHVVSPLMFHKTPSPAPHFRDEHAGSDGMFSAGMTRILHWDDRKYLDSSDSNL